MLMRRLRTTTVDVQYDQGTKGGLDIDNGCGLCPGHLYCCSESLVAKTNKGQKGNWGYDLGLLLAGTLSIFRMQSNSVRDGENANLCNVKDPNIMEIWES